MLQTLLLVVLKRYGIRHDGTEIRAAAYAYGTGRENCS